MRVATAAIVAVFGIVACANDTANKPALPPITPIMVPPAMAAAAGGALQGRVWTWQSSDLAGQRVDVDAPDRYTIEFQTDGGVRVRADCNRGGGRYTEAASREVSLSSIATTKMGCPGGAKGAEFVRELENVERYEFVGNDLVMIMKGNAGAMRFAPNAK